MKQILVWLGFLVFQKLFLKYLFNTSFVPFPQNNRSPSGRLLGDSWAQSPAVGKCPTYFRHPHLSFFWWISKTSSERNSTTHLCILFHSSGRQAVFLIFNLNLFAISYAEWVMAPWKNKVLPAQKLLKYLKQGSHYPVVPCKRPETQQDLTEKRTAEILYDSQATARQKLLCTKQDPVDIPVTCQLQKSCDSWR